jgi:hypothetical protein
MINKNIYAPKMFNLHSLFVAHTPMHVAKLTSTHKKANNHKGDLHNTRPPIKLSYFYISRNI